jgi:hypothetical protein
MYPGEAIQYTPAQRAQMRHSNTLQSLAPLLSEDQIQGLTSDFLSKKPSKGLIVESSVQWGVKGNESLRKLNMRLEQIDLYMKIQTYEHGSFIIAFYDDAQWENFQFMGSYQLLRRKTEEKAKVDDLLQLDLNALAQLGMPYVSDFANRVKARGAELEVQLNAVRGISHSMSMLLDATSRIKGSIRIKAWVRNRATEAIEPRN